MDKDQVDQIITDYMQKIYSFCVLRTKSIDVAEELASNIIFEVYTTLLKVENIQNINGYIYRIARNIHAKYIAQKIHQGQIDASELPKKRHSNQIKEAHYERIRSEIVYLSNQQKEIVVMFYYQKLKLHEIASKLGLSLGTVGWHLSEARKQLKGSFAEEKKSRQQSQKTTFTNVISLGDLHFPFIEASFYFTKDLPQLIAYAAYHQEKSAVEIAKELSVPLVFVEDEINHLLENGFLIKKPHKKYLTNFFIDEMHQEKDAQMDVILTRYAEIVCEKYVPLIFDSIPALKNNFYFPIQNENFLLWSLVSFACNYKMNIVDKKAEMVKFQEKYKNKNTYIASATIDYTYSPRSGFHLENIDHCYGLPELKAWVFNSHYDERDKKFDIWFYELFDILDDFITHKIAKEPDNISLYMKLYENAFIISQGESDYVNLVMTNLSQKDFLNTLPPIPHDLISLGKKLDVEIYDLYKKYIPPHMKSICRFFQQNYLSSGKLRTKILNCLLTKGILKPLKNNQKKTVNMIYFNAPIHTPQDGEK